MIFSKLKFASLKGVKKVRFTLWTVIDVQIGIEAIAYHYNTPVYYVFNQAIIKYLNEYPSFKKILAAYKKTEKYKDLIARKAKQDNESTENQVWGETHE